MAFSNPGASQRLRVHEHNSAARNRRRDLSVRLRGRRRDFDFYSPPAVPLQLLIEEQLVDDQFDPSANSPLQVDDLEDIDWWIRYREEREYLLVQEEIRNSGWLAA